MLYSIQGGNKMSIFDESGREKQLPDITLPVVEAFPRILPVRFMDKQDIKRIIDRNPGFFGVHHWREEYGDVKIHVDLDEYLDMFEQMIEDDTGILKYRDSLNPDFVGNIAKDISLKDRVDRLAVIRQFFGIRDHGNWYFAYGGSDEEIEKWFEKRILTGYTHNSRDKETARREGWNHISHWYGDITHIYSHPCEKGVKSFQFDSGGKIRDDEFPNGDEYDALRFIEMKRITDTIRNNPKITYLEIRPGVGTIIRPTNPIK